MYAWFWLVSCGIQCLFLVKFSKDALISKLFSKDALIWAKVAVETFIMLQNISISNKYWY